MNLSSPCIDAGTPYYQVGDSTIINLNKNEYNGKAPDIGASESNPTGISSEDTVRKEFEVFPNPFNKTISIEFGVTETKRVNLSVYSITGQKLSELVSNVLPVGRHLYQWNGNDMHGRKVASGIYIIRLNDELNTVTRRVLFLK